MVEDVHWFIGIDWATQSHRAVLLDAEGSQVGEREFSHGGAGLTELCDWLLQKTGAAPEQIAVRSRCRMAPWSRRCSSAALRSLPSIPNRSTVSVTASRSPAPRMTAATPKSSASALRTDPHCLPALAVVNPIVIELREWSRIADDLQQERDTAHQSLARAALALFSADGSNWRRSCGRWFLDSVGPGADPRQGRPHPRDDGRRLLKRHRIRRFDAAHGAAHLAPRPLCALPPGTTEAAMRPYPQPCRRASVWSIGRSRTRIAGSTSSAPSSPQPTRRAAPGQSQKQHDVEILRSLPGVGRIVLATLLAEASRVSASHAIITPCAVLTGSPRSRGARQELHRHPTSSLQQPAATAIYHWARVAIQHDTASPPRYTLAAARS